MPRKNTSAPLPILQLTLYALAFAACAPAPATLAPAEGPTLAPAPAATSTVTPEPVVPTHAPLDPVSFYRLRLEVDTTSDWTTLDFLDPELVLAMRVVDVEGEPAHVESGLGHLAFDQPIESAEGFDHVVLTVDVALDPQAAGSSLSLHLEKGSLNQTVVSVSLVQGEEVETLRTVSHWNVPDSAGLNPYDFTVDLSPLAEISPVTVQPTRASDERLLWAFYYPWYQRSDWQSAWLADTPAEPYDSRDPEAMRRHIRQAKAAGIDGFIMSWWGPGDPSDRNLRTMLDIAEDEDFRLMIYFETLSGSGGRPADEIVRWLRYILPTYGDHPAYMRLNGKPVVVLWATDAVPLRTWAGILEQVEPEAVFLGMGYSLANLEVFDGLHAYGVFNIPDLAGTVRETGRAVHNYSLLDEDPAPRLWAATVQPGYDDRLLPDREGELQAREDGAFYRRTFEAALASDPDWIFITSWNEWWENTHIEPSVAFGDQYLEITPENADYSRTRCIF